VLLAFLGCAGPSDHYPAIFSDDLDRSTAAALGYTNGIHPLTEKTGAEGGDPFLIISLLWSRQMFPSSYSRHSTIPYKLFQQFNHNLPSTVCVKEMEPYNQGIY